MGHENAEGMAHVGVRVEPPVRLGRVGTALNSDFEAHLFTQFRFGQPSSVIGEHSDSARTHWILARVSCSMQE